MVNKKPSTGCAACRSRHIKCDETRPSCKRCALRKIECPGYRDVSGVIFVNNTKEITARHSKRSKSLSAETDVQVTLRSPKRGVMAADHDAMAIAFFFSQYMASVNRGMLTSRGHMDHLIPMFVKAKPDSTLALAAAAMAYQALTLYQGGEVYKSKQSKYMAQACQRLQIAVADPKESLQDETLMAVLCLDFSEHLLGRESSRAACRAHVDGAAALIKHRPADSFKNDVSRALFAATRSNVLLQALWFGDSQGVVDFPKIDIGLCNPVVDCQHILVNAITLEQEILTKPDVASNERKNRCALAAAMEVELDQCYARMPPAWHSVITRPMSSTRRTITMLQAANIVGQWHCLKVLVLKLLCATTDDIRIREMIPFEIEEILATICLICDYLTDDSVDSPMDDMEVVEKSMDRTASGVVVASRDGALLDVSSAANGQTYNINILRWVLDEIHEKRPKGAEDFAYRTPTFERLEERWYKVLATFQQETKDAAASAKV